MEKLALADQKAVVEAKHISANEAVLKLKYAEVRSVKLNQAKVANDIKNYYKQEGRSLPRHLLSMPKLEIHTKAASEISLASNSYPNIYKQDPIRNKEIKKSLGSRVGALFKSDFDQLLINYAKLEKKQLTEEYEHLGILKSVCKVFSEFWSYAHSLEALPNRQVYPYIFYPLLGGNQRSIHDIYQPLPLYRGERFVFLRRYLALLSLMCSHNRSIGEALLHLKHGQVSLLQIVSDSVQILGFSQDLPEHFGLLEAFGAFLSSLLRNAFGASTPDVLNPLFDLLKQLVFTRPSPWVFGQLSSCMLACSQKAAWPNLMSKMCVNSPKNCFISDRVRSIYRFGTDSCLVQVYAGLIELCFFNALPLEPSHFQLLLSTCRNHVDFVYQCFQYPPDFILKMLPSLCDAEDDDEMVERTAIVGGSATTSSLKSVTASDYNSTSEKTEKSAALLEECSCECYVKLCLSVVTLVFQLMHQWILRDSKSDTEEVGKISQTAVHLLKLIFRENYLTCLFRDSEETTKHYLSLICNWWTEHAKSLGFLRIHLRFLRQLEYSHFMLKPIILEANEKNPELDLTEWNRTANTSEDVNLNEIDFHNYVIGIDDFFSEIERIEEYHFE
ncbi:ATR-interacting protein mus304 isoform X2 [Drosophila tropicalis]